MKELLMDVLVGMLAEYKELGDEELLVGAPRYGANETRLGVTIGGKPFTVIVREGVKGGRPCDISK